ASQRGPPPTGAGARGTRCGLSARGQGRAYDRRAGRGAGDRSRAGRPAAASGCPGQPGLLTMTAGHSQRALEIFSMALPITRETRDRYAEKTALERIGLAHIRLSQSAEAAAVFGEALALARAVGHRKHEADLLWDLAIAHAELGQREQALTEGEAAITLMKLMRNPQAAVFAEHLRKYQAGETGAGLVRGTETGSAGATAYLGGSIEASLWSAPPNPAVGSSPAAGPGLLRMAVSAAK